jgi:hypothetical protein
VQPEVDTESEEEIAAAIDRLLADVEEGATPVDIWPGERVESPVNPPSRIA